MADTKITALTENTAPIATDIFPMVDDPAGTALTQKVTITNLFTAREIIAPTITTSIVPTTSDGVALGSTSSMFSDLFLASGGVINWNNGNTTLTHSAGLLTSNADIAVPDEAYGAGWNGSTEVPTKNAVYDQIQALSGSVVTQMGDPVIGGRTFTTLTFGVTSTNVARGGLIQLRPQTINSITFRTGTVTAAGTLNLTLYAEDGQSQLFSVTTANLSSSNALFTTAVSSVAITGGNYYLFANTNSDSTNLLISAWAISAVPFGATSGLTNDVTSEPRSQGTISITSGVPATTFDPTAITDANDQIIITRFDS